MERFWKYKLDHVIFWVATVCFHMFTRVDLINQVGFGQFLLEVVVRNSLLAGVIYINLYILIPRFAQQKMFFIYSMSLAAGFLFYVLLKNAHDLYLYGYVLRNDHHFFTNTFYNLSIALFYVSFSVALELSREWYAQRELIRKIEIEKLNTELEYLKAQINPHFLFNSINTIYFQIDKHNAVARDTLSAFSEMLRYQLYECNGKEVPIEKEVAYLKNYVELQRLRKDENYSISFTDKGMHGFTIAPMVLIPFVENAFKHVSHFSSGNEIRITMDQNDGIFRMAVYNSRDVNALRSLEHQGIGLKNVRRRLELLYNGRHDLQVIESPSGFEVNLELSVK